MNMNEKVSSFYSMNKFDWATLLAHFNIGMHANYWKGFKVLKVNDK
jgi:hypothetical protein